MRPRRSASYLLHGLRISPTSLLVRFIFYAACIFCKAKAATHPNLVDLSAAEAVELLCKRSVTAVDYAKALLQQSEEIKCLNTYAALDIEKVLEAAAAVDARAAAGEDVRPLCGLSFAVKDNIDVAGYATVAGTPALEDFVLAASAPLIERLQAANGVVLGKTRMHELAEGMTTISPRYGAVLNPYRPNFHVGGSSGGTAALIAARGAAAGFCSDTAGSCRVPASLTGVVGYRPTAFGEGKQQCYNVGGGIVPMTTTRDTVGLMARAVADVKFLDAIFNDCPGIAGDVHLKGLKVGFPTNWWTDLGDEVETAFSAALKRLTDAGVELVEFDVGLMLAEQELNAHDQFTYIYEMPRELSRYLFQHGYNLSLPELIASLESPLVKKSLEEWSFRDVNSWPTPRQYLHMLGTVTPKITQLWNDYFDNFGFDVIVVPTTPVTARPIDAAEPYSAINGRLEETLHLYTRTAEIDCPSSVPGLSLPIGLAANGLPIGLQLHSRPGDDAMMLAVGEALEAVLPKTPPPPKRPACHGCTHRVEVRRPSQEKPGADSLAKAHLAEELSIYSFTLGGSCELQTQKKPKEEL